MSITAGFIIAIAPNLKEDFTETSARLLTQIANATGYINNTRITDIFLFQPESNWFWADTLFKLVFILLFAASFMATSLKMWIRNLKDNTCSDPRRWSHIRQLRYEGLQKWRFRLLATFPFNIGFIAMGVSIVASGLYILASGHPTQLLVALFPLLPGVYLCYNAVRRYGDGDAYQDREFDMIAMLIYTWKYICGGYAREQNHLHTQDLGRNSVDTRALLWLLQTTTEERTVKAIIRWAGCPQLKHEEREVLLETLETIIQHKPHELRFIADSIMEFLDIRCDLFTLERIRNILVHITATVEGSASVLSVILGRLEIIMDLPVRKILILSS